ncbi:hypothetical protein [Metabacillus litoralis]|uniref:hypothetical protein n=1 Tax=Metabacillus litoralis TaxID=152268 RepID=UPI000EF62708|nr:hypothetical protein [Metabacillus litoralis]
MKRFFCTVFLLGIVTGCVEDKPRPEGNLEVVPLQVVNHSFEAVEVINQQRKMNISVKHHIRDQDVYVECYIPSFTFKERGGNKVDGEGHLQLSVDGKVVDHIQTAAFVIRGLEKGTHTFEIEVVHNDSTSYELKKSWNATIQ